MDKKQLFFLYLCLCFLLFSPSLEAMEFNSVMNRVQLNGPYIKYNVLYPPYSLGRYPFSPDDIRILPQDSPPASEVAPQILGLSVEWPRFLLSWGRLKLINPKGKTLFETSFSKTETGEDEKYAQFPLSKDEDLGPLLKKPFQVCVEQRFKASHVRACSHILVHKEGSFQKVFEGKTAVLPRFNKKKVPKNAQLTLSEGDQSFSLEIKFKSGFLIFVKDRPRIIQRKDLTIDSRTRMLGVISEDESIHPIPLTFKDRIFSFIKENNQFKNQYDRSKGWSQALEHKEMEFSPYTIGASLQLYGLIFPKVPPAFKFKIQKKSPIATYSSKLMVKGTKGPEETLRARRKKDFLVHQNQKDFSWSFQAKKKGRVNQDSLQVKHQGDKYYFSKRVFRAHQTHLAASLALSTSVELPTVFGYNLSADHWFEEFWNRSPYSFQRWGLAANVYNTTQPFKADSTSEEKLSLIYQHFDLMFRFKPGVRPIQSSFGLGLRYFGLDLIRSLNPDVHTKLLGVGFFWHTAPQKIIDDFFNMIPLSRYPKWVEMSAYYYPLLIGSEKLGMALSWHLKGKMFFAQSWFLDASIYINSIFFEKSGEDGQTTDQFALSTAHGTLGIGVLF